MLLYKETIQNSKLSSFILGGMFGAIAFISIWGTHQINPFNLTWLIPPYGNDFGLAATGSLRFLKESWTFPIGLIRGLVYPHETSIVYTDGVPWVAVMAKVAALFIHRNFQYFGLWGFACAILQGGFSSLIIHKFCGDSILSSIGSIFFLICPFFLIKMFGHVSMAGQWVILIGLFFIFYRDSQCIMNNEIKLWSILSIISIGILPYFTPMIFLLMILYYWLRSYENSYNILQKFILCFIISIVSCAIAFWLIGGWLTNTDSSIDDYGLAPYNLNGLLNPGWNSRLIHDFSPQLSNGEAYSWLGLGIIIGGIYLFISALFRAESIHKTFKPRFPFLFICILFIAYAATNKIMYGDTSLLDYSIPPIILHAFSMFRTSARFIWPVWYLIVAFVIGQILYTPTSKFRKALVLLFLVSLQIFDGYAIFHNLSKTESLNSPPPLNAGFWSRMDKVRHVIFAPSYGGGRLSQEAWGYILYQAVHQNITTNTFWLGRFPRKVVISTIEQKIEGLTKGKIDEGDLIVVNLLGMLSGTDFSNNIMAYQVDNQIILSSSDLAEAGNGVQKITINKTRLSDYLDHLDKLLNESTIIITARSNETPVAFDQHTILQFKNWNVGNIMSEAKNFTYIGIINNKHNIYYEIMNSSHVSYKIKKGDILNNFAFNLDVNIDIDQNYNNFPTVFVNGQDFSHSFIGMNICVYDNKTGLISEVAVFDLFSMNEGVYIKY